MHLAEDGRLGDTPPRDSVRLGDADPRELPFWGRIGARRSLAGPTRAVVGKKIPWIEHFFAPIRVVSQIFLPKKRDNALRT
jgi:hypothetical protein